MVNMNIKRLVRHLCLTAAHERRSFDAATLGRINDAIASSESRHGGELRFVVERALDGTALWKSQSPRERAIELFSSLHIWDTRHNSGVLIYVLLADRSVEILADRGIDAKVGNKTWAAICQAMETRFRDGDFEAGALEGIDAITQLLANHFPPKPDESNELPDFPVIL